MLDALWFARNRPSCWQFVVVSIVTKLRFL